MSTDARIAHGIGDRGDTSSWLAAGLCLARVVPWGEDDIVQVASWIVAAIGERLDMPPLGVVADVGALLSGRSLGSEARPVLVDARLDHARRRYEDEVLARLAGDARARAGADAFASLSPDLRPLAVGILVASLLSRIGFDRGVTLQPGIVRAALRRPGREIAERGFVALRDHAQTRDALAAGYEALVQGAQRTGELVSEGDVFLLENLSVLRSLTQRFAIAQVVEAAASIARGFPRRVRSTRASAGDAVTRLEDESEYPVGGFSSISTSGTLENLVTSELIYMESPAGLPVDGGLASGRTVDLFDLRYTEGELLYYTRDEAIHTRRRRVVTFLLGDDLASSRVKDVGSPWQRIVLLLGVLVAAIEKLEGHLAAEALQFRVVFLRESAGQPSALKAERELCELMLREWRAKGAASVLESTMEAEAASLAAASRGALVEVVLFSTAPVGAMSARWSAAASAAAIGSRTTCLSFGTGLVDGADLEAWKESAVELVGALL